MSAGIVPKPRQVVAESDDRRLLQTAVGERVQDDPLRGLQVVEVRSGLADRVVGGERVADRAVLAEELAADLHRRRRA